MTRKANLSAANWNVLVEAGPAIAMAVASAAGSPHQSVHEVDAFLQFVSESTVDEDRGTFLGAVVDPADAVPVRDWYRAAAQRVAEAAREGGILGVGGPPVSELETETLGTIADALGSNQRSPEGLS
jgi:hypothetical protein